MTGHLDIACAANADGHSFLRRQSFCAPIHLSKPHLDEGVLVVNVVNPTAGLFAGDRIGIRVAVESGARLLLTAPSASRAHRVLSDEARVEQEFRIERGAWLEVWPEIFIPQGGARYRQRTTARIEEGGELLLIEMIAPGRAASGEVFAFTELDWETEIFLRGEKIARERATLHPSQPALAAMLARFPQPYYASCFLVSSRLADDAPCWRQIHDLHEDTAWVGCSALARGGWAIRVLAGGSIILRKKIAQIRAAIYAALGSREPALRRT